MASRKFILTLFFCAGLALPLSAMAQTSSPPNSDIKAAPPTPESPEPATPLPDAGAPTPPASDSTPPVPKDTAPAPEGNPTPPPGDTPPPDAGAPTPPASDSTAPKPKDTLPPDAGAPTPPAQSNPTAIPKNPPKDNSLPAVQGGSSKSTTTVDINSATLQEMLKLKGLTASDAKKIIDNRPYANLDELVTKKVLTQSLFSQVKSKLEY